MTSEFEKAELGRARQVGIATCKPPLQWQQDFAAGWDARGRADVEVAYDAAGGTGSDVFVAINAIRALDTKEEGQ